MKGVATVRRPGRCSGLHRCATAHRGPETFLFVWLSRESTSNVEYL